MVYAPRPLPSRSLPVPVSVSPLLKEAIATPLEGAMEAIKNVPPLEDKQAWQNLIAAYDQASQVLWQQLRQQFPVTLTEESIAGINTYRLTPPIISPENSQRIWVHLHGGGYALAGGELATGEAILAAHYGQVEVISIDYRQPPNYPFPGALEDALAVWQELVKTHDVNRLALFGTSAGGGLLLALVCQLRQLNLPLPAAIAPLSPWVDLTKTGDTYFTNEYVDRTAISYDGLLAGLAQLYAGEFPLTHSFISPLYNDLENLPPTLLISGTRDLLLSDTARLQRKLRQSNVMVDLQIFEGLSHGEYLYQFATPESAAVFQEINQFFNRHLQQ
ncbi:MULTISPECIES: alpha/beta hydrolase [unclassified Synechocystis]|uniref:alpha/beta hydrolase n=1 Tax=unclassified Synechocystis TaxID=2640012 RepID=UPI00041F0864|nr:MULTISPECIES: alpha/beta hydrolase [unclassified Synechocystis]AIE73184.1 Esterase/lipase [Synechocystis sp. PCC 6714]MCT0254301.1 alpha/beta hydrolase [Synechocystis sp. CS-94]